MTPFRSFTITIYCLCIFAYFGQVAISMENESNEQNTMEEKVDQAIENSNLNAEASMFVPPLMMMNDRSYSIGVVSQLNFMTRDLFARFISGYLTVNDILNFQQACKYFYTMSFNMIQPRFVENGMITEFTRFSKDDGTKIHTKIPWRQMKYFLQDSVHNEMKFFRIKKFYYAILNVNHGHVKTWVNYDGQLIGGNLIQSEEQNLRQIVSELNLPQKEIATIFFEESKLSGGYIPDVVLQNWKHIKRISRNFGARVALFNDGSVISWGKESSGSEIPQNLRNRLFRNVRHVVASHQAFMALLQDKSVVAWGPRFDEEKEQEPDEIIIFNGRQIRIGEMNEFEKEEYLDDMREGNAHMREMVYGSEIPDEILQLRNVKQIIPGFNGFAILTENDSAYIWGDEPHFDESGEIKNVKMVVATHDFKFNGFFVLLKNGQLLATWTIEHDPDDFLDCDSFDYLENVEMVLTTNTAVCVLFDDGTVRTYGDRENGGEIPEMEKLENVQMIFSNNTAFLALLENGGFIAWGNGGKFIKMDGPVHTVVPKNHEFWNILENGTVINL